MKVTIGIPCFKQAEYLPDALESALDQLIIAPNQIEVIVVNDGSPDNTTKIAQNYGVKVIEQVNKGLASARNTAIMNMTGDAFFPLDADDMIVPTAIELMIKKMEDTGADIVAPSLKCFGEGNAVITVMEKPQLNDFREGNRIPYAALIKKETLLELGGYSPRMAKGWEDMHFWINALTRGRRIETLQEPLLLYRTKKESMWLEAEQYRPELEAQIRKDFPFFYA